MTFLSLSLKMPHWCIAYGCNNYSSDMAVKKSWHCLPLENQELLSKWIANIRRTNTPINEHSRLCGDHFEAECFKKVPGSSRIGLKTGSIPTKFCFVKEKHSRKPPKERTPIQRKQKSQARDDYEEMEQDDFGMSNVDIECDIEEPEVKLLRQRLKELELSLESETIRRKRAEAALEAKRFSVNNLAQDPKILKFYTGFTEEQFYCLLDFLGDGMNNLTYWAELFESRLALTRG